MTASRERFGLRRILVVSQVALSLVLLVGALLFVRSLRSLATTEAGFDANGILIADLGFARPSPSEAKVLAFQKALLEHLRSIPGVVSVADTSVVPISGNASGNHVWMEHSNSAEGRNCYRSIVSTGYFKTLNTPLLAGRDFDDHDTLTSPNVAIVNEAFARQLANGSNPVGRRFWVEATPSTPETQYEVVGLVRNTKYRSLRQAFQPVFFLPYSQDPHPQLGDQLLIRSNSPRATLCVFATTDQGYQAHQSACQDQPGGSGFGCCRELDRSAKGGPVGVLTEGARSSSASIGVVPRGLGVPICRVRKRIASNRWRKRA